MPKSKTFFGESAQINNNTYYQYVNILTELALANFKWNNLPASVDVRFLELTLFSQGQCVFFNDEILGYLALPVAANGGFNVYRVPLHRRAYAVNSYNKNLTIDDSVIIYNNYLRTNTYPLVAMYAKRLYNIDRAIDTNINAQKTPILIKCDEKQRLTMVNLYKDYDGNMPVIFGTKFLEDANFEVLKTDAPFLGDKLQALKIEKWKEILNLLGISYSDKKERMITDEVAANQIGVYNNRLSKLKARQEACEMINKMFGLNISCEFNEAAPTVILEQNTEGTTNE